MRERDEFPGDDSRDLEDIELSLSVWLPVRAKRIPFLNSTGRIAYVFITRHRHLFSD